VPADGQDDAVRGPAARPVGGHGVRIDEADGAEVLHQVDPVPAQMAGQVLLVMGVTGHPVAVGHHDREVRDRRRAVEAEGGPGGPVARQPGRPRQRPHRRRATVEAGAADLTCFEQGDPRAELAGLEGSGDPGRAPAEDQQGPVRAHRRIRVSASLRR